MDEKNLKIIKELGKYTSFLGDFAEFNGNRTTKEMSLWEKLKLIYYIMFKYKRIHKGIRTCISNDLERIAIHPENLIELMTTYLYITERSLMRNENVKDISEFINKMTGASVNIQMKTDPNNVLQKCKVSVFDKSIMNSWFYDKVCKGILEIDVDNSDYVLDITIYDTTDRTNENLIDANILYRKIFKIQADGTLNNSNYAFDKTLELKENAEYARSGLFMFRPFAEMIAQMTSLEFLGIKAKEG